MLPLLPSSQLAEAGVVENWRYPAVLTGSDGRSYVYVHSFSQPGNRGGEYDLFTELTPPTETPGKPTNYVALPYEKFEVDMALKQIVFEHSGPDGRTRLASAPDGTDVTVDFGNGTHLKLQFWSRGMPFTHSNFSIGKKTIFVSGFEDFTTVTGSVILNGKTITLTGYGLQERDRWDNSVYPVDNSTPLVLSSDWFVIHFEQGYALVERGHTRDGDEFSFGLLAIDSSYKKLTGDQIKVSLEQEGEKWPMKAQITLSTEAGKADLTGTLKGRGYELARGKGYVNYPIYEFHGTFAGTDGRSIALTNGVAFVEHLRYNGDVF